MWVKFIFAKNLRKYLFFQLPFVKYLNILCFRPNILFIVQLFCSSFNVRVIIRVHHTEKREKSARWNQNDKDEYGQHLTIEIHCKYDCTIVYEYWIYSVILVFYLPSEYAFYRFYLLDFLYTIIGFYQYLLVLTNMTFKYILNIP